MALPREDPGFRGPAYRRRTHTTLPGEMTAEQLAAVNAMRARLGELPLGGPMRRSATPAGAHAHPAVLDLLRQALPGGIGRPAMPAAGGPTGPDYPPEYVGPMPGEPGAPAGVMPGGAIARPVAPAQPAAAALLAHFLATMRSRRAPQRRAIAY